MAGKFTKYRLYQLFYNIYNDRSNIKHLEILKNVANLCYQFVLVIWKLKFYSLFQDIITKK